MTARFFNPPRFAFFDEDTGDPGEGWSVYFYAAGTLTLKTIYTTYDRSVEAANPVVLDSRGEGKAVLGSGFYDVAVKDADDVTIWTEDNVTLAAGTGESTPFDFGATGDDSDDDYTHIQDLFDSCATTGNKAVFPAGYTFKTTVGVTANGNFDIDMRSPIKFYGDADSDLTVLKVGNQAAISGSRTYELWVDRDGYGDWTGANHTGIEVCNLNTPRIKIRRVRGFTNGLLVHADATTLSLGYVAWARTELGVIGGNKYGVRFKFTAGAGTPFINENTWIGGNFSSRNTAVAASTEYFGFYIDDVVGYSCNSHRFYDQAFEMNYTNGAVVQSGVGFSFSNGSYFTGRNIRSENMDTIVRVSGGAQNHYYSLIISVEPLETILDDTSVQQSTTVVQSASAVQYPGSRWDSGPLGKAVTHYAHDQFTVRGFSGVIANSWSAPKKYVQTLAKSKPDWIATTSTYGFGCEIDVERMRRFVIFRETVVGFPGFPFFQCRDKYGDVVHGVAYGDVFVASNVAGAPYIDRSAYPFVSWQSPGATADAADSFGKQKISVAIIDPSVVSVYVLFGGGGKYKRIQIQSLTEGAAPHVTSGFKGGVETDSVRIATEEPDEFGWYTAGELIYHDDTTVDTPIGWRADNDGYMCPDAWVNTTAYVVDDVVHNGGEVYICVVAGTSAGAGGPSGTSGAIVDGTVTWKHVAALVTFTAINSTSNITDLTDNSGGTANDTVEAIPAVNGSGATTAQETAIANNFADLAAKVQKLIDNAKGS